jgi:hypothetical protein
MVNRFKIVFRYKLLISLKIENNIHVIDHMMTIYSTSKPCNSRTSQFELFQYKLSELDQELHTAKTYENIIYWYLSLNNISEVFVEIII